MVTAFTQESFPEINIALSKLDDVSFANSSAEVLFRKLTETEIKQYANPDIQQLLAANETLVSESKSTALYGIMYQDEVRSCLMMACLMMRIDDRPVFMIDGFTWTVNNPTHLLNELALQLSAHPSFNNDKDIFINWQVSLFEEVKFRNQKLKNIKTLQPDAAMLLQLIPKKEDFLPNISISSKGIEVCNNSPWQLSKENPETFHQRSVRSLKKGFAWGDSLKEDANFCTLSRYHLYAIKFKESTIGIKAYLNENKQIILYMSYELSKNVWFPFSQALLKFTEEAKKQGYNKVLYANDDRLFKLPFRRSEQKLNITNEMKLTIYPGNLNGLCLYDLDAWDFVSEVGDYWTKSPALINLAAVNDHKAVEYYLQNGADVNALDRYQRNALHEAVYNKNLILVYILCEAGINQSQRNNEGSTPLDIAQKRGTPEIIEYLSSTSHLLNKIN